MISSRDITNSSSDQKKKINGNEKEGKQILTNQIISKATTVIKQHVNYFIVTRKLENFDFVLKKKCFVVISQRTDSK